MNENIDSIKRRFGIIGDDPALDRAINLAVKVAVTDRVGTWVEIKLPNGEKGWVEDASIEII